MATYIDFTSEEEQAQSLVQFLQTAKNKGKEPETTLVDSCSKLITDKNFVELWSKLSEESNILFVDGQERDVENFFTALVSLLKRLGDDSVNKVLPKLLGALTASTDQKPLFRLKILGNVYNILNTHPQTRFTIFMEILNYSIAAKHVEILVPHFQEIDTRTSEWGLDKKQISNLYQKIRDIYRTNKRMKDAFKWSVKYLLSLEKAADSEAIEEAANLAKSAISIPDLYQMDDLLDIPAMKALEKDSKNSKVYQLLSIFISDTFDAYKTFVNANPNFLKELGLEESVCVRKMILLTLATLGASNRELTFSTIAKSLHISEDEVELWVITAVSEGILEAKIDQLKSTVLISRSLNRTFSKVQWKYLGDSLNTWKQNVQLLAQTLHNCKLQTQQQAEELLRGDNSTHITQI